MYLEYYFIENLLINYIIISCTSILTKNYNSRKRKWLGAFLGAVYSVLYIYPSFDLLFTVPFKIIIMTLITLIAFTHESKRQYIRIALVFYLVNVFLSGSTFFIIYFTGIKHTKISFIIICVYISCELLKYIYKDIKTLQYIKQLKKNIDISLCGKNFNCNALIDSGNLLKDPTTNNEVIVVKPKTLEGMLSEDFTTLDYENIDMNKAQEIIGKLDYKLQAKVRLIPYMHAGSTSSKVIIGFKADYVEIDNQKITNIVLGVSNFDNFEYDAILSPALIQNI